MSRVAGDIAFAWRSGPESSHIERDRSARRRVESGIVGETGDGADHRPATVTTARPKSPTHAITTQGRWRRSNRARGDEVVIASNGTDVSCAAVAVEP